jgi:hypothetical protein
LPNASKPFGLGRYPVSLRTSIALKFAGTAGSPSGAIEAPSGLQAFGSLCVSCDPLGFFEIEQIDRPLIVLAHDILHRIELEGDLVSLLSLGQSPNALKAGAAGASGLREQVRSVMVVRARDLTFTGHGP